MTSVFLMCRPEAKAGEKPTGEHDGKKTKVKEEEEEGFEHVLVPDCFRLSVPFVMVPEEKKYSNLEAGKWHYSTITTS
jgi:hypothetical protein